MAVDSEPIFIPRFPKIHDILSWGQQRLGFWRCEVLAVIQVGYLTCLHLRYKDRTRLMVCCKNTKIKKGQTIQFDPHLSTNMEILARFKQVNHMIKFATAETGVEVISQ